MNKLPKMIAVSTGEYQRCGLISLELFFFSHAHDRLMNQNKRLLLGAIFHHHHLKQNLIL